MKKQTIKILGCQYDLSVVAGLAEKEELCGQIDYDNQLIRIAEDVGEHVKSVAVMHEVLHGIWKSLGEDKLRQNERVVDALANALVQVLRENPTVVDMVRGVWK